MVVGCGQSPHTSAWPHVLNGYLTHTRSRNWHSTYLTCSPESPCEPERSGQGAVARPGGKLACLSHAPAAAQRSVPGD